MCAVQTSASLLTSSVQFLTAVSVELLQAILSLVQLSRSIRHWSRSVSTTALSCWVEFSILSQVSSSYNAKTLVLPCSHCEKQPCKFSVEKVVSKFLLLDHTFSNSWRFFSSLKSLLTSSITRSLSASLLLSSCLHFSESSTDVFWHIASFCL